MERSISQQPHVDRDLCIGAGNCELLAPEAFEVANDGMSHVIGPVTDEEELRRAIEECPTGAISRASQDD